MFTKKSLLISGALLLVCTVALITVVATLTPSSAKTVSGVGTVSGAGSCGTATCPPPGLPAIPATQPAGTFLTPADISHFLALQGPFGFTTPAGQIPAVGNITLSDVNALNQLHHINLAGIPLNQKVYYVQFSQPVVIQPNLPTSALATLLPSAENLLKLHTLPGLAQLIGNKNICASCSAQVPGGIDPFEFNHATSIVLKHVYIVFDAVTGNLLAWG